jgi:hypothetical protein
MNKLTVFICSAALLGTLAGCSGGSDSSPQADKDMHAKFAKTKFDMNDVPPNQRAMVQGFIDRAKAGVKPGSAPSQGAGR